MENIFDSLIAKASGITADHPLADVVAGRTNIIELTEAAHDAALVPDPPGGISHPERAALACRIARLNNEDVLAKHYESMIGNDSAAASIADTAFDGEDDACLKAMIRHTDMVAVDPKQAVAGDIDSLKAAGIAEDDIVRLSEINAFVSYQIRLVVGLRLMGVVA